MTSTFRAQLTLLVLCVLQVGCGVVSTTGSRVTTVVPAKAGITGHVHGGQQAISGAHVYLYAVSTIATAGPALPLLHGAGYVTTGADGSFSITGDYTCPDQANVYLLALGGNPGLHEGDNAEIALAAGIGSCSAMTSSTYLEINEVTTVATAYSLALYANTETEIGSASDLSLAFANIPLLVDQATGAAVASGQNNLAPQAKVNTLANSIAACINSSGVGAPCSTLMSAANVSGADGTPVDTFQAALNIAKNPTVNVATVFGLGTADAVFAPTLSTAPTDWSLAPPADLSGCILADANTYKISTSLGDLTVELRPDKAPKNVANFLSYVNSGEYTNTIIHRAVPGFVVQGGGYTINAEGNADMIQQFAPVVNEQALTNVRGTMAAANAGLNTATSQFFFNVVDNSSYLNSGTYASSVYAQFVSTQGYSLCAGAAQSLAVVDAIQDSTIVDEGGAFDELPVINYTSGPVAPANFIYVNSITPVIDVATTVATPLFTVKPGLTGSTVTLSMTDTTPGAQIYYGSTTEGKFPVELSTFAPYTLYTGPIQVDLSMESIGAYATAPGYANNSTLNVEAGNNASPQLRRVRQP